MKKRQHILILILFTLWVSFSFAQYPQHFTYDNENGLPSNEVYRIVQDNKSFIWIGCDAGLFKFDGVRYTSYKCKTQNSKSISNLTLAPSGVIYCVNFQDQIFYLENDTLKELSHQFQKISNIALNKYGLLYINHSNGISVFHPETKDWRSIDGITDFTRSVVVNDQNKVYFLVKNGLAKFADGKISFYEFPNEINIASNFLLICHQNNVWIFKRDGSVLYTLKNEKLTKNISPNLLFALKNRKVTSLKSLPDGKLWICTYNGIICYNTQKDSIQIFYPNISFSDVLIDRESNYWFTTLQAGILRVSNLNSIVWNSSHSNISNEKLTHIATDGTNIYFSSINGTIGKLNATSHLLQTFFTDKNTDIESFNFDTNNNTLFFHSQNKSYSLKDDKISEAPFQKNALKHIVYTPPFYFLGSSIGLYVETEKYKSKISESWIRQLAWNNQKQTLYAATNKGFQIFKQTQNQWVCTDTLFKNTQIVSIDFDENNSKIFALTFDGKIYSISDDNSVTQTTRLPQNVQGNKLKHYENNLFIASNKGVWICDLSQKQWNNLNALSGLASENVQDLIILNKNLWLATGKGLQKIPLENQAEKPLAKVYLKNALDNPKLNYKQSLILYPEASIYASNGNFEYAYRINKNEWIKLPATVEQIEIPIIPVGDFEVELKVIDHLGRNSENTIILKGFVAPPFWQTWWFFTIVILLVSALVFFIVKNVIANIRNRERAKSELLNSQLKAIRAQMNPHFMYNTLNSIQDLILQNDIKSTNYYLSKFSALMRQILAFSEEEKILLSEETEMLENYLELEKLRFGEEFSFTISVDDTIDATRTYIPSLIVQPFVENAIKHGLLHKKDAKKLTVYFSFKEPFLEIEVEDNGVGRKRAAEIKQRSGFSNQSFSTQAVQKRLELLNKSGQYDIEIYTHDTEKENKTGTRVVIKIRL